MWEIIQDETDVPASTALEAFRFLETFLTWLYCHELRPKYVGLCMQNLKEGKSVPFSLKLLQKLIGTQIFNIIILMNNNNNNNNNNSVE
jgi:hypothetical protein